MTAQLVQAALTAPSFRTVRRRVFGQLVSSLVYEDALKTRQDGDEHVVDGVDAAGEPVQYSAHLGPVRLVVVDTTIPGEDPGALDNGRLAWLDAELAAVPEAPTIVAMHHPPILTGSPVWDDLGLPSADRAALRDVVGRHRQVRRIVAGHVHRTMTGELGGAPVLTVPSTYVQAELDFGADEIRLSAEPPGFAVHAWLDGELVSYVVTVS